MRKKVYFLISVVLVCVIAILWINQSKKNKAVEQVAANLSNMVFEDVEYTTFGELRLTDHKNNKIYRFYGAKSTFAFNQDGMLTWTRQYDRSIRKNKWTEPITTTEKYEVVYLGDFWCDIQYGIFLKLESGEILEVRFRDKATAKACMPSHVNYNVLYTDDLPAPEELMNIDTSYISTSGNTGNSSSGEKCAICNGTGSVRYYYGSSDLEALLSGHDPFTVGTCTSCGGSGRG